MKPLLLRMQAFGPYSEKVELDFSVLGEEKLFLITGPTGVGKTSILDGIVFALYGQTSGGEREGRDMRSDYADPTLETYVEFVFSVGDVTYKVVRMPQQELKKKRGEGTTQKASTATLYIKKEGEWEKVTSRANEFKEEITRRLGFRVDQFLQVVLLPQGEFRKLLLASTSEREGLLHSLFPMDVYKRIEQLLKTEFEELELKSKDSVRRQAILLESLHVETIEAATEIKSKLTLEGQRYSNLVKDSKAAQEQVQQWSEQHKAIINYTAQLQKAEQDCEICATLLNAIAEKEGTWQLATKKLQDKESAYKANQTSYQQLLPQGAILDNIEKLTIEIKGLEEKCASWAVEKVHYDAAVLTRQKEIEKAKELLTAVDTWLAAAVDQTAILVSLNADKANAMTLAKYVEEYEALSSKLAKQQDSLQHLKAKAREIQRHLEIKKSSYELNLAHQLAISLEDGHPCPVCGALEHPSPMINSAMSASKEEVIEAEETNKAASHAVVVQQNDIKNLRTQITVVIKKMSELDKSFVLTPDSSLALSGEIEWSTPNSLDEQIVNYKSLLVGIIKTIEAEVIAAESKHKEIQVKHKERDELSKKIETLEVALKEAVETVKTNDEHGKAWENAINSLWGQKQGMEKGLAYVNQVEWKSAVNALEKELIAYEEEKKHIDTQREVLTKEKAEAQGREQTLQEQIRQLTAEKEKAITTLTTFLKEVQLIERYETLEDAMRITNEVYTKAVADESANRERIKQITQVEKQYMNLEEQGQARREQFEMVTKLYELASGKATGIQGVSFERFVLMAVLDEVIVASNSRLREVSRGRYELIRTNVENISARGQRGLDLSVFDSFTGHERPANTLSGGETFLASLSLALGLADVIQSYAGGIHLDTIFIDEGFGTLDPDTLDVALRTLVKLQESGRLIGVISHVPELKQRIRAHLDVSYSQKGSVAKFVV